VNVTKVIWRGLSKSNRDVCLLASIGGNSKTSLVFELSLIPTAIIEAWDEYNAPGDACMIPPGVWTKVERAILRRYALEFWLAYTHGWDGAPHLQATHVASVNSRDKALEARGMDWSVFEVLDVGAPMSSQSALCPGSKEFSNKRGFKIGCGSCPMACNAGAAKKWRAVVTHGNGDASRKAAANRRGNNELMNERGQVKGLYVAA